jgi:SAM-dependent methyltransferase
MTNLKASHWDSVYRARTATEVSWYEARPEKSMELIRSTAISTDDPIVDVGAGASLLVDELLNAGYRDLTVLDISATALERMRERLGARGSSLSLVREDVTVFQPNRLYALWHDRAVFHFMVQKEDRELYVETLRRALRPAGHVVMATFGPEGPERCSGLSTARYDAVSLAAELGPDFQLVDSVVVVHRTPWNTPQQFLYCHWQRKS